MPMRRICDVLREDHRPIEESLDALESAIAGGGDVAGLLRFCAGLARAHYEHEGPFLECLGSYEPAITCKLRAQHEEAIEMAALFDEAIAAGQGRDAAVLARKFHAIAQHNIIEEERDVFPLTERCFSALEQGKLLDGWERSPDGT
jgi:hypothetical protein